MRDTINGALNKHGAKYFVETQAFLTVVTIVSIISIILETVQSLSRYNDIFRIVELFAVVVFCAEYILRIWVSENRAKYIFSFWGFIDVISILPTFLTVANFTFLKSFRELRILRMLRVLRLGKISRSYLESQDKAKTQSDHNRINITIYFMTLFSMIIIFGSLLYAFEHNEYAYSNIPLAMVQSTRDLIGGLSLANTSTLGGNITIIVCRFVGLALFGLLIAIIGGVLNNLLFGDSERK